MSRNVITRGWCFKEQADRAMSWDGRCLSCWQEDNRWVFELPDAEGEAIPAPERECYCGAPLQPGELACRACTGLFRNEDTR